MCYRFYCDLPLLTLSSPFSELHIKNLISSVISVLTVSLLHDGKSSVHVIKFFHPESKKEGNLRSNFMKCVKN
jgi:hypothetical protein